MTILYYINIFYNGATKGKHDTSQNLKLFAYFAVGNCKCGKLAKSMLRTGAFDYNFRY